MWTTISTTLVTFLLTGVVGNWLVQKWQHRNWFNQQSFLGKQKEYYALQQLFDEIASAAGRRITRMRRLTRVLSSSDDDLIKRRRADYDTALTEWNDKLSSFCVRTSMLASLDLKQRLEHKIQPKFVEIGEKLDSAVSRRLQGKALLRSSIAAIDNDLNALQGMIDNFSQDMLREILNTKDETYFGIRIALSRQTLHLFPTWDLVKALFKPGKPPHTITRTAMDLHEPSVRRD